LKEEDAKHIQSKCLKTKKWREDFVCNKWLKMNEDTAYSQINKVNVKDKVFTTT
jgi:hypothetical protein